MGLPFYREIVLQSVLREEIESVLTQHNQNFSPMIVNVLNLGVLQNKALQIFEASINKNKLSFYFPYSIYFISDVDNYRGSLSVFASTKELPHFFKGKDKIPNVKEGQIINRIELKAKKIQAITHSQIENAVTITNGAKQQKELYLLSQEGHYLEQIRNHIIKSGKAHDR